jgi:hypothetical protein
MASFDELFRRPRLNGGYSSLDVLLEPSASEDRYAVLAPDYSAAAVPREGRAGDIALDRGKSMHVHPENADQLAASSGYCAAVRAACRAECSMTSLPSGNFGWRFFNCVNDCVKRHGCDPFRYGG